MHISHTISYFSTIGYFLKC